MNFNNPTTDIFVPDGVGVEEALARTTQLGICAHADDLEVACFHGISSCFNSKNEFFAGVTCADGAGCPRTAEYANFTIEEMKAVRREEQRQAAALGRYSAVFQLDYTSQSIKSPQRHALVQDLLQIIGKAAPQSIYTHSLADKHPVHVAVVLAVIQALRSLPPAQHPRQFYGVEVWRDLDWLPDQEKVLLDVSRHQNLAQSLIGLFDSQIAGGKRYDLAVLGRRQAHATFLQAHQVDQASHLTYAMDLSELLRNPSLSPHDFVTQKIKKFSDEVSQTLELLSEES